MAEATDAATQKMVDALPEKTGRSLADWQRQVAESGKSRHGEIVAWLKGEHGVTHGYANLIAHKTLRSDAGSAAADGADLVALQYAGAKAGLKPIFEAVVGEAGRFGDDVELAAKKGYVSLRRSKQFALVQPSTASRVDLGLQLKGEPAAGRLEAAGSWNAMVSHRVRLTSLDEVDDQLVGWLRQAYERA